MTAITCTNVGRFLSRYVELRKGESHIDQQKIEAERYDTTLKSFKWGTSEPKIPVLDRLVHLMRVKKDFKNPKFSKKTFFQKSKKLNWPVLRVGEVKIDRFYSEIFFRPMHNKADTNPLKLG